MSLQLNVIPGFPFPTVGRLGLTSPPSRSVCTLTDHRYYGPLRLPTARLGFLRCSLSAPDTLRASALLCVPFRTRLPRGSQQQAPGLLISQQPYPLGVFFTRRQLDLPSSQVTPMTACPGLRPRWCPEYIAIAHPELLPSIICKMSAFLPVSRKLSNDHKEQDFGAQYTACSLDPSGLGLLLPGLPSDFTTDLLATL